MELVATPFPSVSLALGFGLCTYPRPPTRATFSNLTMMENSKSIPAERPLGKFMKLLVPQEVRRFYLTDRKLPRLLPKQGDTNVSGSKSRINDGGKCASCESSGYLRWQLCRDRNPALPRRNPERRRERRYGSCRIARSGRVAYFLL